ncbi:MAG: hypothetical protein WD100_14005, partial [Tistlia sp.]
ALLARLPAQLSGAGWSATLETRCADLGGFDWPAADLVTASALLDLVSERWLEDLIRRHPGAPFYFALSIDGRVELAPPHAADGPVLDAFAADLRGSKGLGQALGGEAPARAEDLLREAGYQVATAASDWNLGREDAALAEAWLSGVTAAGEVQKQVEKSVVTNWLSSRLEDLEEGRLGLRVGHRDLLALPLSG